jgi:hypothetical protein
LLLFIILRVHEQARLGVHGRACPCVDAVRHQRRLLRCVLCPFSPPSHVQNFPTAQRLPAASLLLPCGAPASLAWGTRGVPCLAGMHRREVAESSSAPCAALTAAERPGATLRLLRGNIPSGWKPALLRIDDFALHTRKTVRQERLLRNAERSLELAGWRVAQLPFASCRSRVVGRIPQLCG